MDNCIFCKIIKGDIPNYTVYEDDNVLAFLDIEPRTKGHTLVIPKKHGETTFDLDFESLEAVMVGVQKTMERIDKTLRPDGYNVGWNHGEAGGQVVPHVHVHIMPRWKGDGGGNMHSIVDAPDKKSVEDIAKLF